MARLPTRLTGLTPARSLPSEFFFSLFIHSFKSPKGAPARVSGLWAVADRPVSWAPNPPVQRQRAGHGPSHRPQAGVRSPELSVSRLRCFGAVHFASAEAPLDSRDPLPHAGLLEIFNITKSAISY